MVDSILPIIQLGNKDFASIHRTMSSARLTRSAEPPHKLATQSLNPRKPCIRSGRSHCRGAGAGHDGRGGRGRAAGAKLGGHQGGGEEEAGHLRAAPAPSGSLTRKPWNMLAEAYVCMWGGHFLKLPARRPVLLQCSSFDHAHLRRASFWDRGRIRGMALKNCAWAWRFVRRPGSAAGQRPCMQPLTAAEGEGS